VSSLDAAYAQTVREEADALGRDAAADAELARRALNS
jgi:hypothetical protein